MIVETLKWSGGVDGYLDIIDQRRLPASFERLKCDSVEELYDAIKTLAVRGAPAIGVAAGYGLCLAMKKVGGEADLKEGLLCIEKAAEYLASARPTAVNLFWALERVKDCVRKFAEDEPRADVQALREAVLNEAHRICEEDRQMCLQIGVNGEQFIEDGGGILTHCNAGALATAGQGTALSCLYEAKKRGKRFVVYADETRPLLQGARLTAWELGQAGIDVTVICDNMAGWLMKQGKISSVITGADRIAANGDAANKIGTYSLSILAKEHGVPFYVAAPSSTFDLSIKSGEDIPIEQRSSQEVISLSGVKIAPEGVRVYNPAFDVVNASDITAIITECGVVERPDEKKIGEHFED